MIQTGGKKNTPSFYVDEYEVYVHSNVSSLNFHHKLFDESYDFGWDIVIHPFPNQERDVNHTYFFCDTYFEDAFGHWIFESAIYIPLYWKLKKEVPTLKWLLHERKEYKEAVLKGAGLQETDITYCIDADKNTFYFPSYTTHHDATLDKKYKTKLDKFKSFFHERLGDVEKTIDYLYLPRGNKENFKANDRLIMCQPQLIEYFSKKPNSSILFTDQVDNFLDQLRKIVSAKTIILDYGSSFIVNSFFSKNSKIICIGYDVHHIIQVGQVMLIECVQENGTTFEFIYKQSEEGEKPKKQYFSLEEIYSKVESVS